MTRIYQSDDIKELASALSKAQGVMDTAKKDKENTFFKSKYADMHSVREASKKALADNGLSIIHIPDIDELGNQILVPQLMHSSGQWIRGFLKVTPVNTQPQVILAALTYMKRGGYGAMTGVVAEDEDDDGNEANGRDTEQKQTSSQPTQQRTGTPGSSAPLSAQQPLPHPANAPAITAGKSVFASKVERDSWHARFATDIAATTKLEELENVKDKYRARIATLKSSTNAGDKEILKKVVVAFDTRWDMLIPKAPGPAALNVDTMIQQSREQPPSSARLPPQLDDEIPF